MTVEVDNLKTIDLTAGAAIIDSDHATAKQMIATLAGEFDSQQRQIINLQSDKNWPELANMLHKIRSGASYCGTPKLHELLRTAEQMAIAGDNEQIASACKNLFDEIKNIQIELKLI